MTQTDFKLKFWPLIENLEIASDEIKLDFHELESGDLYDSYRSDRKKESDTPDSRKDSTKTKRKKIRWDFNFFVF